ncbi:MAG TPA: MFS transporter [Rugosimonospora sp.]|nr:MFS transporter [Rugosimonospora sp.]
MMEAGVVGGAREVTDVYGRRYRIGESDASATRPHRTWMVRLSWLSMLAVSLFQYGFAAAVPALVRRDGFTLWQVLGVLAGWVVCQAGVALPAVWVFQRAGRRLAVPMLGGAVLCLVALVTLARSGSVVELLLGYSVPGGIGAGLVYVACIGVASEWFPERIARTAGVVSGAFGYGALPFVVAAAYARGTGDLTLLVEIAAGVVFVVLATTGVLLRRPPAHWWPPHIDPQSWAVDRRLNRSIPNNMPAARAYPPRAAVRSGMLPMMFVVVVLMAATAFFDIAYLAGSAVSRQPRPVLVIASLGVLALATGVGRTLTSSLSDRLGRRRTLGLALAVAGLAQFGLLAVVPRGEASVVAVFAALAGAGTGAGYSLLVSMVRDWFGVEAALSNYAMAYVGKAVGALAGIGLAGFVLTGSSAVVAFAVAGVLSLLGAALTARMRQPGYPVLSSSGL